MRLQGLRELPRQELRRRAQTDDLIRVVALSTFFGERCVLQDVDFAIRRGEVHVIMGPSGCGTTTLLRHLNGLRARATRSLTPTTTRPSRSPATRPCAHLSLPGSTPLTRSSTRICATRWSACD
jgi:energy-coupling factor transporter ATP-binding protein EcfA2